MVHWISSELLIKMISSLVNTRYMSRNLMGVQMSHNKLLQFTTAPTVASRPKFIISCEMTRLGLVARLMVSLIKLQVIFYSLLLHASTCMGAPNIT